MLGACANGYTAEGHADSVSEAFSMITGENRRWFRNPASGRHRTLNVAKDVCVEDGLESHLVFGTPQK
jgi:hypothetical protein